MEGAQCEKKMWKAMIVWLNNLASDARPAQDEKGHGALVDK